MDLKDFQDLAPLKTGFPSVDYYLGGIQRGRFSMFSGRENAGKTTLCQNIMGSVQQSNPEYQFLWVDNEGSFTKSYALRCGIVEDNFSVHQDNDIQSCLSTAYDFIQSNNKKSIPSFVVIDSVAGFSSEAELRKGFDGDTMAVVSRVINKFLRLTTIPLLNQGSVVVFTNQLRDNLNSQFGGTTTPGGRGLRHWCNLHLQLYDTTDKIEVGGEVIGQDIAVSVQKIKSDSAFRGFSFKLPLIFGEGFSKEIDLINLVIDRGIIEKAGAWFKFQDNKFHGKAALITEVKDNPELKEVLYKCLQS